jgi:peptidoglycan/xylan/chitin deacetylase (PgdA/CDA1 family)
LRARRGGARKFPIISALLSSLIVALLLSVGSLSQPSEVSLASSLANPQPPPDVSPINSPTAVPATVIPDIISTDATSTALVASHSSSPDSTPTADILGAISPTPTPAPAARTFHDGAVPILMYHYIRVNPVATDTDGFTLSVTPSDFARQMHLLSAHGFTPVTVSDVREFVRNRTPLPPNPVAITFDDGYSDAYSTALPILEKYHYPATFYVITGFVDQPRYLTWDQVGAMDREGMEIASHTVHHFGLTVLGSSERQSELIDSRAELERRLGHPVLDFCYPGGQIDPATEIAVGRAGYLSATTTAYGRPTTGDDPLRLPRLRVWGGESLTSFASLLGVKATAADEAASVGVQ